MYRHKQYRRTHYSISFCLSILTAIIVCSSATAQAVRLGVHAGLNVANAESMSNVGVAARNGILVGATVSLPLATGLDLVVGAQYVNKGIRFGVTPPASGIAEPSSIGDICSMNYLEIPVNVKFGVGSRFQVFVEAGTNVGTLLSAAREKASADGQPAAGPEISKVNVALEAGGGMSYALSPGVAVMTDVRYTFALVEQHGTPTTMLEASSWKPRELKITSGVTFTL